MGTRNPAGMNQSVPERLYSNIDLLWAVPPALCVVVCVRAFTSGLPSHWFPHCELNCRSRSRLAEVSFAYRSLFFTTNYHLVLHKLCTFFMTSFITIDSLPTTRHFLSYIYFSFLCACVRVCFCCVSFWVLRQLYPLRFHLLVHIIGH